MGVFANDRKGKSKAFVSDSDDDGFDSHAHDEDDYEDTPMADADEDALAAAMLLPAGSSALAASTSTSAAPHPRIKVPRLTLKFGSGSGAAAAADADPALAAADSSAPPVALPLKRGPGRPPKKPRPERDARDRDGSSSAAPYRPWLAPRPDVAVPSSPTSSLGDDDAAAAGDEGYDPYGGLLSVVEADGTGRRPDKIDRERFRDARRAAELQERVRAAALEAAAKGGSGAATAPSPGAGVLQLPGTPSAAAAGGGPAHELRPTRTATPSGAATPLAPSLSGLPALPPIVSNGAGPLAAASSSLAAAALPPATPGGLPIRPITHLRIGEFELKTWYQAPFPDEYTRVADGRLWVCEWCLKYMKSGFEAERHRVRPALPLSLSSRLSSFSSNTC